MAALPVETVIRDACLLEATARKAGNVHPGASFEHLSYSDFVASAEAIAPVLATAPAVGTGQAVLNAVQATRTVCQYNTNLGITLLLAPLVSVPSDVPLRTGIGDVLNALSIEDSRSVFAAIRLAAPRGLGESGTEDVAGEPTQPLVEIMQLAADRDLIARQYSTGFQLVFDFSERFLEARGFQSDWESQVIRLQLELSEKD